MITFAPPIIRRGVHAHPDLCDSSFRLLCAICFLRQKGMPTTYRACMKIVGWKSLNSMVHALPQLVKAGLVSVGGENERATLSPLVKVLVLEGGYDPKTHEMPQ